MDDGFTDGEEFAAGSDPILKESKPIGEGSQAGLEVDTRDANPEEPENPENRSRLTLIATEMVYLIA